MNVHRSRVVAEATNWLVVLRSSRYTSSTAAAPRARFSTGATVMKGRPVRCDRSLDRPLLNPLAGEDRGGAAARHREALGGAAGNCQAAAARSG